MKADKIKSKKNTTGNESLRLLIIFSNENNKNTAIDTSMWSLPILNESPSDNPSEDPPNPHVQFQSCWG